MSAQPVAFVNNPASQFQKALDDLHEQVTGEIKLGRLMAGTASFVSLGVSVLYILWTIRAGYLVASLLSSMPAWQFIDPLPILNDPSALSRRRGEVNDDDDSIESLVDHDQPDTGVLS